MPTTICTALDLMDCQAKNISFYLNSLAWYFLCYFLTFWLVHTNLMSCTLKSCKKKRLGCEWIVRSVDIYTFWSPKRMNNSRDWIFRFNLQYFISSSKKYLMINNYSMGHTNTIFNRNNTREQQMFTSGLNCKLVGLF